MNKVVTCKNCAYSFDEVNSETTVHCCRHKKTMNNTDTCEDGKEY